MASLSVSAEEKEGSVVASPAHVSVEISAGAEFSVNFENSQGQILHRVPPQLRENKNHLYDPVILSIGPYHHGKIQLRQVEEVKGEVLNLMFHEHKYLFCRKISERVDEIRNFYGKWSIDEHDDEALVDMMVRDACFILYSMEIVVGDEKKKAHIFRHLGQSVIAFICHDLLLLENQIPLWVIKLLISLAFDPKEDRKALLYKFLSIMNFGDDRLNQVPWGDTEQEPLHLLEAHRIVLLKDKEESTTTTMELEKKTPKMISSKRSLFGMSCYPYRSVTDLKTKRIQFRPSSHSLKDIRFSSKDNFPIRGTLHLPVLVVNNSTKVFLSNVIAMEMSPESNTTAVISSYVNFMKSLVGKPEDVKELREKGILFNCLGNDDDVVKMFKEVCADGTSTNDGDIFEDVQIKIHELLHNKSTMWMTQVVNDYFGEPMSVISFIITILVAWLTTIQTYFAIIQAYKK